MVGVHLVIVAADGDHGAKRVAHKTPAADAADNDFFLSVEVAGEAYDGILSVSHKVTLAVHDNDFVAFVLDIAPFFAAFADVEAIEVEVSALRIVEQAVVDGRRDAVDHRRSHEIPAAERLTVSYDFFLFVGHDWQRHHMVVIDQARVGTWDGIPHLVIEAIRKDARSEVRRRSANDTISSITFEAAAHVGVEVAVGDGATKYSTANRAAFINADSIADNTANIEAVCYLTILNDCTANAAD